MNNLLLNDHSPYTQEQLHDDRFVSVTDTQIEKIVKMRFQQRSYCQIIISQCREIQVLSLDMLIIIPPPLTKEE